MKNRPEKSNKRALKNKHNKIGQNIFKYDNKIKIKIFYDDDTHEKHL